MSKADLKIDWATHAAAKHACERWHYSGCLPSSLGKRVAVGAWENGKFIGVVIFGHGANRNIGVPHGLTINECVELTRIALKRGHSCTVSRIVSLALKMLAKSQPGIRLVVSYADQAQGHHGGIYQAGNWVYVGSMKGNSCLKYKGKKWHPKALWSSYPGIKRSDPAIEKVPAGDKHKYLMPLDKEMRKRILPLAKPYPKRASSDTGDTPDTQSGKGGSIPTDALQAQPEVKP